MVRRRTIDCARSTWEVVKKANEVGYEKGLDELEGVTRLAAKTVWRALTQETANHTTKALQ